MFESGKIRSFSLHVCKINIKYTLRVWKNNINFNVMSGNLIEKCLWQPCTYQILLCCLQDISTSKKKEKEGEGIYILFYMCSSVYCNNIQFLF